MIVIGSVGELVALLAAGAGEHDEVDDGPATEAVDLLDHAVQCAAELATRRPDDIELQIAGLIHDIGHQLRPGDDAAHGRVGADAVRGLLGERVARLVEYHVPAKRYLVSVDAGYASVLSSMSIHTLGNQGGAMSPDEIAAFEALPDAMDAVLLRLADDAAKVPRRAVPVLESWRPVLTRVATA